MKKIFIFAAAVATLAACQKNSPVELVNDAADNAIGFSAYTATAVTKGSVRKVADIIDPDNGIGVFAFYQPAATGDFNTKKYATPDFMYNQQVKPDATPATVWTYSPLKYWPNNTGDKLSFFAYAPYEAGTSWEDMGISTDVNATKMKVSFPIYDAVEDQIDYLWADPQLNLVKPDVAKQVEFEFNHITSQINLFAAVETDAAAQTPAAWAAGPTTITINKVEFKGLAESIEYEYALPAGTLTPTYPAYPGEQDIVLTEADFVNNTSAAWTDTEFHQFNKTSSVMFVAPQTLGHVVITYTVSTTDTNLLAGKSEITNVITKDLSSLTLVAGNSYKLNFLIGMTSVKIDASATDWVDAGQTQIDVPENTAP